MLLFSSLLLITFVGVKSSEILYDGSYKFLQELQLSDKHFGAVGYQIRGFVMIEQVHPELLSLKLGELELFGLSKTLYSSPFSQQSLKHDFAENHEFFIQIKNGIIDSLYVAQSEKSSLLKLKKSLSSLLQFQIKPSKHSETDVNGHCETEYQVTGDTTIHKVKSKCSGLAGSFKRNIFGGALIPRQVTQIKLSKNKLMSVLYKEENTIKVSISNISNTKILIASSLEIIDSKGKKSIEEKSDSVQQIIDQVGNKIGQKYSEHKLSIEDNLENEDEEKPQQLTNVVKENIKLLKNEELGKKSSALAALKVLRAVRGASSDDIYRTLKAKSTKEIVGQLLDILGAVQTSNSHEAAKKFLKLNSKDFNLDNCERYLWALSMSVNHDKAIIKDLLELAENGISDSKLLETLVQTIASMSKKYVQDSKDNEFLEVVLNYFSKNLENCPKTDELCQRTYLKGFTNIGSSKVLELLLKYALDGPKSVSVRAMKAILNLGKNEWTKDVYQAAQKVLFTNGTAYDSSAKTLALDILLEASESSSCFSKLIQILKHRNASFELKEYLLQRLAQVSDRNKELRKLIKSSLINEGLYHYDALAQGGLSTAFDRRIMGNGYLSTAQEIKSGILKQGYVHINLEDEGSSKTVFTLGLFSNGLGSFVSSDSESDEDDNTETSAGLELSVLGVEMRPFVFFTGQGELMGHVFSGTGSTLTPAYQAILLLSDETASFALGTGDLLKMKVSSLASVDLSGKIEISLWSRAAESLVQNSAGLIIQGETTIDSPFLNVKTAQNLTAEPQLKLSSDIQFSEKVALCLQLEQPETTVEYSTSITAGAPGNEFKKQKSKARSIKYPGTTYALNSKNNEMCNDLFS